MGSFLLFSHCLAQEGFSVQIVDGPQKALLQTITKQQHAGFGQNAMLAGYLLTLFFLLGALVTSRRVLKRKNKIRKMKTRYLYTALLKKDAEIRNLRGELSEKNELIEQLKSKYDFMEQNSKTLYLDKEMELIKNLQSFTIVTEEHWLIFKEMFERLEPGFFVSLLYQFPDLTNADQRLLALVRLNLTQKEIADVLGISPASVQKGSLRLRRKLGMVNPNELINFALNFSSPSAYNRKKELTKS